MTSTLITNQSPIAVVSALEIAYTKQTGKFVPFSRQELTDCFYSGCNGGDYRVVSYCVFTAVDCIVSWLSVCLIWFELLISLVVYQHTAVELETCTTEITGTLNLHTNSPHCLWLFIWLDGCLMLPGLSSAMHGHKLKLTAEFSDKKNAILRQFRLFYFWEMQISDACPI